MDYQPYISPMNHWISLGYHEKNHGYFHHESWDIPKSRIHCVQLAACLAIVGSDGPSGQIKME